MHRMNIALCAAGELYGGVEQFIYTFSHFLTKDSRLNLTVILFNKGILYAKLKEANIETYVYPGHKYNLFQIKQIMRLFNEKKIHIVHTNGYKANILCGIAAKFCKAKIVKTEHGKIEPSLSKNCNYFKMVANICVDIAITKALVNTVVFVSNDIRAYYGRFYGNLKSTLIHNGIPQIEHSTKTKLSDFDYDAFSVGIVGRLSNVKGHIYLLNALKLLSDLKDLKLYVFGDGQLHSDLLTYCRQNQMLDRVMFMGFRDNIQDYMRALDLFVMPSLHEGLPYALLEAMHLKVPIIATSVGGLKEILENNTDALLIPPCDKERMAEVIRYLYNNPKERKRLAGNAYRKVTQNFVINKTAAEYLAVYENA